jgi:hypothetical protein
MQGVSSMDSKADFQFHILGGLVAAVVLVLAGCVDLVEPWKQGLMDAGTGDNEDSKLDGAETVGGSQDTGVGWIETARPVADGAVGEIATVIDTPPADSTSWVVEVGNGELDADGSHVDVQPSSTDGTSENSDVSLDIPMSGTGGIHGTGGMTGMGGRSGTGGRTGKGGTSGTGGVTGTGGKTSVGGTSGTGGMIGKDAAIAPDVAPDLGPDTVDASTLPSGLVAYYPCDSTKSDGITLPDMSGNGNDGTLIINGGSGPGYGFGTGMVGNALELMATGGGYVSLPLEVFAGADDITIATWVRVKTIQDFQRVFDVGINANLYYPITTGMIYMYLVPFRQKNEGLTFGIATNGLDGEQSLASSSIGPSDGWTHLAVVLGDNGGTLYVNGTSVSSSSSVTLRPKDLGSIDYAWIGRSQFTSNATFDGAFDEFRVYQRALAEEEIRKLYNYKGP